MNQQVSNIIQLRMTLIGKSKQNSKRFQVLPPILTEEINVSGKNLFGGQMTYCGQEDAFWYTAEVGGQYRLETDGSSGGAVRIRVRGENGSMLKKHVSIELSEGKLTSYA